MPKSYIKYTQKLKKVKSVWEDFYTSLSVILPKKLTEFLLQYSLKLQQGKAGKEWINNTPKISQENTIKLIRISKVFS